MSHSPNKLVPVIIGTLVITFLSVMPLVNLINIICCAGVILGGLIGVNSYIKQCKIVDYETSYKDAVIIGLLSGLLSALIVSTVNLLITLFTKENPASLAMDYADKFPGFPESAKTELEKISQEYIQYGISPTIAVASLIANIITYPLFSMVGALIGMGIFQSSKRNKKQNYTE